MSENINYTYESKPVDIAILGVLDVTSDGKIVSAADWTALWNTVLTRINHLDKYCSDISTLIIRWQESITAFDKAMSDINAMFNTLSNSFIHYGEEAPTDANVRLWVQPNSELDSKSLVNKAELTAAITNSEAAVNATTDQKLKVKADKLERITQLTIAPELPEGVTQFIADSNISRIIYPTIDEVWMMLGGYTIPKDSVITIYHLIMRGAQYSAGVLHKFYLKTNTHWSGALGGNVLYGYHIFDVRIKDSVVVESTHQFVKGNTEFPNIPKAAQSFDPNSEDAQSGVAIAKYITDNVSDVIIETSHSVSIPVEVDCCLVNQPIVSGNVLGANITIVERDAKQKLVLPENPVLHFSPINPIKNCTFTGPGLVLTGSSPTSYKFTSSYATGAHNNTTLLELGQDYTMRFDVTCADSTDPCKWQFGVFSKNEFSSRNNVAASATLRVYDLLKNLIYEETSKSPMSYINLGNVDMTSGRRYTVEFCFTSSYSGEAWFLLRAAGAATTLDVWSCIFCKTEALSMLFDTQINTQLLRIGDVYDSVDLKTKQLIKKIEVKKLDSAAGISTIILEGLPSTPAYFVSGSLENPEWIEFVTPEIGTANYNLSRLLKQGYVVYCKRYTASPAQLNFELPEICTDAFELYTESSDGESVQFQTSIDTKKSTNAYLKKIVQAIVELGGIT